MSGGGTFGYAISSFPFSAPFTVGTYIGGLYGQKTYAAGQSSSTDGFNSGRGKNPPNSGIFTYASSIEKFPFSAPFTIAVVSGDLTTSTGNLAGQSSSTDGYTSGGQTSGGYYGVNVIENFPFSSPFTVSTDVGDLSIARRGTSGQNSSTTGYTSGGYYNPGTATSSDRIDSFPFSSPFTTATDIGNLSVSKELASGQSSSTEGFVSGGISGSFPATSVSSVDSFPFSSPFATATDVGDLVDAKYGTAGVSGSTDGYAAGGQSGVSDYTTIDSFPFSSPFTAATNIGGIYGASNQGPTGHQG